MRFTVVRCLLIVLFSLRAAWSVPVLVNPDFASGLTGWTTAGAVITSTNTLLAPSPYAVLTSVPGITEATAEGLLGLFPGQLSGLFNISLVFQDIGGTYTAADTILADVGGLSDSPFPNAVGWVGVVDLTNRWVANGVSGFIRDIIVPEPSPPNPGTDLFSYSFGPLGSPFSINTSGPARLFALVANAGEEHSALAVTFMASEAPEIDPGSATLPIMMLLGLFMLVAERRRRLPAPQ